MQQVSQEVRIKRVEELTARLRHLEIVNASSKLKGFLKKNITYSIRCLKEEIEKTRYGDPATWHNVP